MKAISMRKLTKPLRWGFGLTALSVVAPRLAIDVTEYINYQKTVTMVPRPFTKFLSRHFKKQGSLIGAEIGFGVGKNAENLLRELDIEKLYCIDPYIFSSYEQSETTINNHVIGNRDIYYRLLNDHRVKFIRLTSDEAFKSHGEWLKDIDFVYVDGNHDTPFAFRDIINSFKTVKKGGVAGGHDFTTDFKNTVVPAVLHATALLGVKPSVCVPDFWFLKGR